MNRIGFAEVMECRLCMANDEAVEHVLYTCPVVTRIRYTIIGKLTLTPDYMMETSPHVIIDFIKKLELEEEL